MEGKGLIVNRANALRGEVRGRPCRVQRAVASTPGVQIGRGGAFDLPRGDEQAQDGRDVGVAGPEAGGELGGGHGRGRLTLEDEEEPVDEEDAIESHAGGFHGVRHSRSISAGFVTSPTPPVPSGRTT